ARARGGRPRRARLVRRDACRCPPHARRPPYGAGAGGSRARGHGAAAWRARRPPRRRPMRHPGWLSLLLLMGACSRSVAPPPPTTDFTLVSITATRGDPASRRVVWSVERPTAPIATPGEVALGPAYVTAARKVVEELLAPLGPERPPAS